MSIRTAGGIEAIVACITAHPGSVDVAYRACWAMINLAVNAENQVCDFRSYARHVMLRSLRLTAIVFFF